MLKQIARVSFLAMLFFVLLAPPSEGRGGGGGGGGGAGGHGGGWGGGHGGGWGGGHGGGSGWHGGSHHHGHHGNGAVFFGAGVGFGPWWGWGWPGWGWPGPYWYDPGWYGSYYPPVVEQPTAYIQGPSQQAQPAPQGYWYYCPSAQAYYPQTPTCNEPWVKVPPRPE
jgi:hypothetical protein